MLFKQPSSGIKSVKNIHHQLFIIEDYFAITQED